MRLFITTISTLSVIAYCTLTFDMTPKKTPKKTHAFTCKKCGGHVVMWRADVWRCQVCENVLADERVIKDGKP